VIERMIDFIRTLLYF